MLSHHPERAKSSVELNSNNSFLSQSMSRKYRQGHLLSGNEMIDLFASYYDLPSTTLSLELADRCNLRCPGCWVNQDRSGLMLPSCGNQTEMIPGMIENSLGMGRNLGIVRLQLIGGEPTLYPDLAQTVQKALRMGYRRVSITTNGVCSWKKLEELIRTGITDISFSIDGSSAQKHDSIRPSLSGRSTFQFTVENLRKALLICDRAGINVRVNHTLFPANFQNGEAMIRFVAGLGVKKIRIHYTFPVFNADRDLADPIHDQNDSSSFITPSEWLIFCDRCNVLADELRVEIVIPRVYGKKEAMMTKTKNPPYLIAEPDGKLIMCNTHGMLSPQENRYFATIISDQSILLNPYSVLFQEGPSKCCKAMAHLALRLPSEMRLRIEEVGGIGCIYVKSPLLD